MIYWGNLYAKLNSNQLASPSSLLTFLRACLYIVMCLRVCVCVCKFYACLDMYPMRVIGNHIEKIPKQNQKTNLR